MTKPPDVIVIGGGIFGLASAFELLSAGLSVTLIDKAEPGSGASGGILGALSPHMPDIWDAKKAFQLKALLAAPEFWLRVEQISGLKTGYGRIGRLMPILSQKGRDLAEMRIGEAETVWPNGIDWHVLDETDPNWFGAGPFGAVQETLSARIFPRAACIALTNAIQKLGAMIQIGEVKAIETGRVTLTEGTTLKAPTIVLSAANNSFPLVNFPHDFGSEVKGQAALLSPAKNSGPLIFADGLYILPHEDGRIAVGSTNERDFSDPHSTDDKLDALITKARAICPALQNSDVTERWANLRPRASLPDPIIGPVPDMPGVFIASGGFKIGFGLAPAIAETVVQLVKGQTPILPERFTPPVQLAHAANSSTA